MKKIFIQSFLIAVYALVAVATAHNAALGAYSAGVPNATTAEAQAGTLDTKFMTPKDVKDAIKSITGTTYQAQPANPTGTTSAAGVMMGLAGSFTPTTSGKMMLVICGTLSNSSTAPRGVSMVMRYGTGAAPTNGAALTGTTVGNTAVEANTASADTQAACGNAVVTGMTLATAYWLDVSLVVTGGGGTGSVSNVSISAIEL